MKIEDIKLFLQNKLASLEASKMSALSSGDIEAYNKLDAEFNETTSTLNRLNSI